MKSVMIIYNQANNERVEYMLDTLGIRGFSQWENVQGRGNVNGDPHRGTHTWPEMNNAILTIVPTTRSMNSSPPSANSTSEMKKSAYELSFGTSNRWSESK